MNIKLNIANPRSFSAHRSGWAYAMNSIMKYHDYDGILLDDFIDITFGYNYQENKQSKKIPYKQPWIGFLHHPPSICPWYEESYRNNIDINIFLNSAEFQTSAKRCQCLFVLSDYLKNYLRTNIKCLKDIPIITIKHPTEPHVYKWDFKKFKMLHNVTGLKFVSIGYFLRNLTSIFLVHSAKKNLEKIILPSHLNMAITNMEREIEFKDLKDKIEYHDVKIIDWQNNTFYDKLLEQSLVFLDLYDTSCNNAIIESIVRSSPLLVNRHPAIEEYLGHKYPLFYKNLNEIDGLLNYDLIESASQYLSNLNHKEYDAEYFSDTFVSQLTNLGIFTKKSTKSTSHKHQLLNKSYKPLCKTSDFNHRFGWPWVMDNLKQSCQNIKTNIKNAESLYINDFADHTFKTDDSNQTKSIVIDNHTYRAIRGYNLFSYKNSDLALIENKFYIWSNFDQSWIEYSQDYETLLYDLPFLKITTYKNNDWVGFFHNPTNTPNWFDNGQNLSFMMKQNSDLILSLHRCKKIFVLSEYMKPCVEKILIKYNLKVPVVALKHPAPTNHNNIFNYTKFSENPKLIQMGYWLRKMHSFWQIDTDMDKWWLYGHPFAIKMLKQEKLHNKKYQSVLSSKSINQMNEAISSNNSIKIKNVYITRVDDDQYDNILCSSVCYLNMYDTSANNSIIDCILSQTPILVNKLPAVVEYLGEKYPLYFNSINMANKILKDRSRILDAHHYLRDNTDLRTQLDMDVFLSKFYNEIKLCKK